MQRLLISSALLVLASAPALAQDPVKVAAKQCKVAFENEYVRVLRWTVGPGEKTAMHDHPALVSISLAGGKTRFTSPDGKTRDVEGKAGQVTWSEAEKHSSQSMADKAGEIVQVELKKKPGADLTGVSAGGDAVKADSKHYHVELQNDRVRVLRIKYGPGEKSVMHEHPAGVAVFLTDGKTRFGLPDGTSSVIEAKVGQVQWNDKQRHLPENTGSKPFEVILVELR